MNERLFILFFGIALVAAVIFGISQVFEAIECGNKGGAYLTNTGSWPVCVKVEKL